MQAWLRSLAFCSLTVLMLSCSAVLESQGYDTSIATPTPTYDCTYYSTPTVPAYNDLASCQAGSNSNCTYAWESFPSGGVALCYFPPTGYESCLITPPTWDWIYTPFSDWCDTGTTTGGNEIYKKTRSVIQCSSTLCYCSASQLTTVTCAGAGAGVGQCGSFTPNPLSISPAPSLCP